MYIICLISENTVAGKKVFAHKDNTNGGWDFLDFKDFYEGVEENAKAVLSAKNNIQELFYAGEKKPHMWWDEFEIRLSNAFAIVDKDAGRKVHTDELILCLLNKKVRANFLTTMKMTIEMQMSATPITMTYSFALTNDRNTFNQMFPIKSTVKSNNRRIQNTYSCDGRGGRGNHCHQGCVVRGGREVRSRGTVSINDYLEVTGLNVRTIRVHPYIGLKIINCLIFQKILDCN